MGSTNSLLTDSAHDNSQKLTWKSLNKSQSPSKLPIRPLHFSSTRRLLTSLPNIYQTSTKHLPSVYQASTRSISKSSRWQCSRFSSSHTESALTSHLPILAIASFNQRHLLTPIDAITPTR